MSSLLHHVGTPRGRTTTSNVLLLRVDRVAVRSILAVLLDDSDDLDAVGVESVSVCISLVPKLNLGDSGVLRARLHHVGGSLAVGGSSASSVGGVVEEVGHELHGKGLECWQRGADDTNIDFDG